MTRDQLVTRLRAVEGYLFAARQMSSLSNESKTASPVEQDFVAHDALRMLDRSGTPAFIYELDNGLRVLDANHAFATLSGYFGNDLWTLCLTDLLEVKPDARLFRALSKSRPRGFVETGIWRGRNKNSELRRVIASGHDLVFQGRRARFVVLHSAREADDRNLSLTAWVQALPVAAYCVSSAGVIQAWNTAAEQLLGHEAAAVIAKSERRELGIQRPEIEDSTGCAPPACVEWNARATHKDGHPVDVMVSASMLPPGEQQPSHELRLLRPAAPPAVVTLTEERTPPPMREWRWAQDAQLRFTEQSDEAEHGADGRVGTWIGRTLLDLPVRWQSVEDKRRYVQAVDARHPFKNVELHLPEDGRRERTLQLSGGPQFDETGEFRGYRGVARDLTQRRHQDAQLQLLASLLGTTEDAVIALSTDLAVVSWNPGAQRLLGYGRQEILGRRLAVLGADSDGELPLAVAEVARHDTPMLQRPGRVRHLDGSEVEIIATCAPVRNPSGQIVGLSLMLRDASHTDAPRRALAAENLRLRQVLDGARLHLWEQDLDTGEVRYDDALLNLLGYEAGELAHGGAPFADIMDTGDSPKVLQALQSLQRAEIANLDVSFRVWRKSGQQLWLHTRAQRVEQDGPAKLIGHCADVTARKHQEQSSKVFSALAEAAGAVVFSLALDGLILSWSAGAEAALGYRAMDVVGTPYERLLTEAAPDEYDAARRALTQGAGKAEARYIHRCRDNATVRMSVVLAPIRDHAGELREIACLGQVMEDAASTGNHGAWHLARVVESCRDAVISFNSGGLIESFNLSAEKLLGYEREEVIALPLSHLFDTGFAAQVEAVLQSPGGTPSTASYAFRQPRREGSAVDLLAGFFPVVDEGRVIGAGCILRQALQAPAAVPVVSGDDRFQSLIEATHQAVWLTNARGEMAAENASWQRYTGQNAAEATGGGWIDAIHPEDREHALLRWSAALASGSPYECPQRVRRADGQWRNMIARAVPVRNAQGEISEWIGIHIDITEQRNTEDALRESEGRLQSILNSAAEGIIVIDENGSIERLNIAAQRMFGVSPEEYWSLDLKHLIIELDREFEGDAPHERYAAWLRRMIGSQQDLTGRRKDGRLFPLELSVNEVSEGGRGTRFVGIVRDVTERKSWEARIFQLAYSDSLTGLPNRLLLVDRLEQAVAAAQRNRSQVGVLFFDFDGFKLVNDRHGHHIGDLLLKGMSDRIRNCVREIDTVSRLGGDEFVVVLPELKDGSDAGAVARKITAALSQPFSIEHQEISVTLTAGISIYPEDGENAEVLIRNADTAMYFAKESGKNRFRFFNPDLQALH